MQDTTQRQVSLLNKPLRESRTKVGKGNAETEIIILNRTIY
jgi:hypothetical protein